MEVDIGGKDRMIPIEPGQKVPVKFDKPGQYPIHVNVAGYPDRRLTVEVLAKLPGPPAQLGVRAASASASSIGIGMGSLYAGWYSNACDGTTGHKWPFKMWASAACTVELRILSGGSGPAWTGSVNAGENIVVLNNPSGVHSGFSRPLSPALRSAEPRR